jgi:hypothetical protein
VIFCEFVRMRASRTTSEIGRGRCPGWKPRLYVNSIVGSTLCGILCPEEDATGAGDAQDSEKLIPGGSSFVVLGTENEGPELVGS